MGLRHFVAPSLLITSLVVSVPLKGNAHAPALPRGAEQATDAAVKAAFLFNFTKFTDWPALAQGAPLVACVVGDEGVAAALVEIVGVHTVAGHRLVLGPSHDSRTWRACHLLFIAELQMRRSADALAGVTTLPVLTVSDTKGFARSSGIIELYANAGQLHFAINVAAAERSGLRLGSQLLSLARIIRQNER